MVSILSRITSLAFFTLLNYALSVQAQTWRPVAPGIIHGISGIATIEQTDTSTSFLIVHDNKRYGQQRFATITVSGSQQPEYNPIDWPKNTLPKDLEGLTIIPERNHEFLALTSRGQVYHIRLTDSDQGLEVLKVFELPTINNNSNFEGLALQQVNGRLIVAWAHRGNNEQPAILYWTTLDLFSYTFSKPINSISLTMPWPVEDVRHISDLKIDSSGAVFITSTADPGNDGPFASALYLAGTFQVSADKITFLSSQSPVPLLRFNYHKIEAFDLLPGATGGLVFGTDDENFGSSLYLTGD